MNLLNRKLAEHDRVRFISPAYGYAEGEVRRTSGEYPFVSVVVRLDDGPDAVVPIAAVERISRIAA